MALSIILICLGLHQYARLTSLNYQQRFCQIYFAWALSKTTHLNVYGALAVVLLPILLLLGLVFVTIHAVVGVFGYYLLNVLLLWFCLDLQALLQTSASTKTQLVEAYQGIFALIFWFVLFGPVGLWLYFLVKKLTAYLANSTELVTNLLYSKKLLALLDWVPIRLCGLSFALSGHFNQVLKDWSAHWRTGLAESYGLIQRWGMMAVTVDSTEAVTHTQVTQLLYRVLLIWLVAIALVTIGVWFG